MTPAGDSISRNAAFALAAQLTSAAFTAVVTVYLVRELGPSGYGVFALAVGIGALVALVADMGIAQSVERFVAEERGNLGTVRSLLADAVRLKLIVATVACGALASLAGPIADAYGEPALAWTLRAVALAVLGQTVMFLYRGAFVALGRVSVAWRVLTLESAVEAGATIVIVALGGGAAGAAWGRAAGYVVGAVIAAAFLARMLGGLRPGLGAVRQRRRIAAYAGALFLVNAAFVGFEQIDVILIGAILSVASVGVFEAPLRLAAFLSYGGQALAFGVAPRLVRESGSEPNVKAFTAALRYLVLVQAALLAPALVWAEPMVELVLGDGYGESAGVLRALAPFVFLSAIGTFVTLAVNYLGAARSRIPLAVGALAVNAILDAVLVPTIGVVGAAIGTDVGFTLYVLGHLVLARRLLGFAALPLAMTLARALVAAVAMGGVLALFGTTGLSALEAVAGSVCGLAAFCAALVVTGAVSRRELLSLPRTVSAALGRRA